MSISPLKVVTEHGNFNFEDYQQTGGQLGRVVEVESCKRWIRQAPAANECECEVYPRQVQPSPALSGWFVHPFFAVCIG